jgi:two-component system invasion response regulator UvrY
MKKTLLVDPHQLVRRGLAQLLCGLPNVEICAEVATAEAALEVLRQQAIDLVLMEWAIPGLGGLEAIARMKRLQPGLRIVVVTAVLDAPFPRRLLENGVEAVVSKNCTVDELLKAVRAAIHGGHYISPEVAQRLASSLHDGRGRSPFEDLSKRELQVMLMFIEGMRVQDISAKLCLSPKTVSTYRYRMFDKLGVRGEVELTRLALRYGIVDRPNMTGAVKAADNSIAHH